MNTVRRLTVVTTPGLIRNFSVSSKNNATYSCKLLIIGGGSGGCTMAAKFSRRLPQDYVIVLEPNEDHYYQPQWTLVGAGITSIESTRRSEKSVLPKRAKWAKDYAACVMPDDCKVKTKEGHVINYEYLIVAVGIQNDYAKVPGLAEALEDPDSGVSSIYDARYCEKTWSNLQRTKEGNAIFTYPDSLVKCPGAPQKIAYLADSYFSKAGVRDNVNLTYNTCLPVIFGVPKYAKALLEVVKRKNITVNYKTVLKEVNHEKKEAVFYVDRDQTKTFTTDYSMLHVCPPMQTPDFLRTNFGLSDKRGFLNIDMYTLQHVKYPNIYGIGDCTSTPNSKTTAAIAAQCYILEKNLLSTMQNDDPKQKYNGYGACPLVTSYSTVILAEFIYDGVPHETMPFNQAQEARTAFLMKKYLFPPLYWHVMLKGYYHGPATVRKIFNPMSWN